MGFFETVHSITGTYHDKLEQDTQQINLHTLGYSIFANFSERDIIEWDITMIEILHENNDKLFSVRTRYSCNHINFHTTLNY